MYHFLTSHVIFKILLFLSASYLIVYNSQHENGIFRLFICIYFQTPDIRQINSRVPTLPLGHIYNSFLPLVVHSAPPTAKYGNVEIFSYAGRRFCQTCTTVYKFYQRLVLKMDVPNWISASGWIPFAISSLLTLLFSCFYILHYKSKYDSEAIATISSILAISVTFMSTVIVPVDVFLVSFMKDSNGTFKDWSYDVRDTLENTVLYAYYALYICTLVFMFFIIPFAYFYYEEKDELRSAMSRTCSAFKFTLVFLFLAGVLVLLGAVIPFKGVPTNSTDTWDQFLIEQLKSNRAEDVLSFTISVLTTIGMAVFIFYAGYGMSVLPCGMIKGTRSVIGDLGEVEARRAVLQSRKSTIGERYRSGRPMSSSDRRRIEDIEEEELLLSKQDRHLTAASESCLRKCCLLLRPCQMVFGVIFAVFGFLLFLSLLLTNIDKIINSMGPKMGYMLPHRKLPNPIDMVLVQAQQVFPLDYIIFVCVVLFLLFCCMSGTRKMGIWFFWIRMHRIRPRRTKPQGLLLLCMTLMFSILAINVIVYALTPQYMMFGDQKYWGFKNDTGTIASNGTMQLLPCSTEAGDNCVLSRASLLISRFCYKAWIFGATYYWASWVFLGMVVIGSIVSICKRRASLVEGMVDRDDFDDSDEDLIAV